MTRIELPFGKGKIEAQIPEERLQGILVSRAHSYHPEFGEMRLVEKAMQHPIGSERLRDLAKGKKNIVMIASDHTRPVPSKVIMPAVLKEIKEGSPDAVITVLIATGFHRPTTRDCRQRRYPVCCARERESRRHGGNRNSAVRRQTADQPDCL